MNSKKINKRKREAFEYVYLLGHSRATELDVQEGRATYVGEISEVARLKKQRDTKWIRWKEDGVWKFALRATFKEQF